MTHRIATIAVLALLAIIAPAAEARVVERSDLLRHFEAAGTTGTMVVHQTGRRDRTVVVGSRRSQVRFLPSSTFKIPNALIAIDTRVASGAGQPYPGPNPNYIVDGKEFLPEACEGDLTLRTAFSFSCIPIFQRIARRVGWLRYQLAVWAFDYGNRWVGGAPLDSFWLEGPFGISAAEQVEFLERLRRGALPVSARAAREVRDMMVLERGDGWVLRGKTGWVFSTVPDRGWWVGSVEGRHGTSTFALNLDITDPSSHPAARLTIGRAILQELGAFSGH